MNPNPCQIIIKRERWIDFLKTPKPKVKYSDATDIDDGLIRWIYSCDNDRDTQIISLIGFLLFTFKDTEVWQTYLKQKSVELDYDFSQIVNLIPNKETPNKGVAALIKRTTLATSFNGLGNMHLTPYQRFIAETAWHWLNHRLSSVSQDKYYAKHGYQKLDERIKRFRAKLGLTS